MICLEPIVKKGTRILRPSEFKALLEGAEKSRIGTMRDEHTLLLKIILYSGLQYTEVKRFQKNPIWFAKNSIHLPPTPSNANDRYIPLPSRARDLVPLFFRARPLPSRTGWVKNLRNWARFAGLSTKGLNAKTLRKTWVAWLVAYFKDSFHSDLVVATFGKLTVDCIGIQFSEEEKADMHEFLEGWA